MSINQRKFRGKTQKLYYIDRDFVSDDTQNFSIMGSTGNVYIVTISTKPTCTCPDYVTRNKRCKHIFFVLLRIMKISENIVEKKEFSDEELFVMFANSQKLPANKSIVVDYKLKEKWEKMKKSNTCCEVKQREVNDDCPICLEEMSKTEKISYCRYSCGNNIHEECLKMWLLKNTICVYCRAPWKMNPNKLSFVNIS